MLLKAPKKGIKKWAQAHLFLGTLQNESGESRKALASLTRAMKLSPQDPAVYREMAQCYYNLGEAPSAVHVWGEGVVNMPTSSEGFFNLGLLMRELGGKHAERCYKTALRLQPDSAPTMLATCTMQSTLALRAMRVSQSISIAVAS